MTQYCYQVIVTDISDNPRAGAEEGRHITSTWHRLEHRARDKAARQRRRYPEARVTCTRIEPDGRVGVLSVTYPDRFNTVAAVAPKH